ncbi:hypothetical protein AB0A63_31625 [Lentzea sp. NPDC042327]|uniref:hypothetical protein n=1 Tax=Lentzea sp. NPDC042327 TaxID=3154801 RepID=UPI0033CEB6E1
MYVVRDNACGGVAVSWGTDRERLDRIAAIDPDLEVWPDLTGPACYWWVQREGMAWTHPYDLDAQHAEIV